MTPHPDDTDAEELEELVFQCLEADDPERALAQLRLHRPKLEKRVVRIFERLRNDGLLDVVEDFSSIPERLGSFRLLHELGAGGMGVVYLAEQEDLGRRVALKLIRPEQLFFPGSRERFRREVEAVARLQHPGIVPVFTVGEEKGLPFFSMEYVAGKSLAEVLRGLPEADTAEWSGRDLAAALEVDRPDPSDTDTASRSAIFADAWPEVCIDLATQVAEALEHAHARGVLHRDVKPSNILVTRDGRARLVDFGLALTEDAQQITKTSTHIGSLPYMPPEQLDERTRIASVRQDVYSLGVTLYEMLTRTSPYLGETAEVTRQRILEGKPTAIRTANSAVSWDLETVCLTAMDPDPAQRYASATALLRDLDNLRHRRDIEARRPSLWIRARRWEQRHPTLTAALGVGVALVAVAAVLLAMSELAARREADRLTQQALASQTEAERRAAEASQVTAFLVDLFRYASPDKSLGEELPISLLLNQGASRIEDELRDQPMVRARMSATFGRVYAWLEEPDKAVAFYRRAIAARRQVGAGRDDPELLTYEHQLAHAQVEGGDYGAAERGLERLLQIARALPATDSGRSFLAAVLRSQGTLANLRGDSSGAESLLRRALAIEREIGGATPAGLVRSLRALAAYLSATHQYREAHDLLDECLRRSKYPDGHPARIAILHETARNLAALGKFEPARSHAEQALKAAERVYGAEHPMVARVLHDAAYVERESGNTNAAIPYLERAHGIATRYGVFSDQYFARMLHDLGISYHTMGRYEQAQGLLQRALKASRRAFAGDHLLTGFLMLRLAEAQAARSEMGAADELVRDGLAMVERLAAGTQDHARALTTRAWIATQNNELEVARQATAEAVAIADRHPTRKWLRGRAHAMRALIANLSGDGVAAQRAAALASSLYDSVRAGDHPGKALMLYHKAWARLLQGDRPAAESFFKASIAMYRRMAPRTPYTDIAWPLNHYGFALLEDRPEEAIALLGQAWEIRRRVLPRGAYWRLVTGFNLGQAYANAGDFEKAEPLMLGLHEAITETYGVNTPFWQSSRQRLHNLYTQMGRPETAAQYKVPPPENPTKGRETRK